MISLALLLALQAGEDGPPAPPAPPAPSAPEAPAVTSTPAAAASAEPPAASVDLLSTTSAASTLSFADHLFLDGDWYRAITEYRRFLYEVKGRGDQAERAAVAIGEALARGEQWDAAGRQLDGVAQRAGELELRHAALFAAGRAYLLDQRPELAKPRFRLIVEDGDADAKLKLQSKWLLAWGHFDAGELDQARVYFQDLVDAKGRHAKESAGVIKALDDKDKVELKDPLLAGVLSLVPGLGHFYLGQFGIGTTSLVWNSLFIFAAASAWLSGDWGVAAVLTIFELGWYAGGIFGAVAGAVRHNRDAVKNWKDEVLVKYGTGRELPEMHEVEAAPPGTLLRFGGTF